MAPAPEVWFYHLERATPEQVLSELLEKTLARGWRARIQCATPERMEEIDKRLWADRPDSFLPHGMEDEDHAERQPILLGLTDENPNGAQALFLLDGAEAPPLDGYARVIDLFDGGDPDAVAAARDRWKAVKALGLPMSYWRQSEAGKWVKQA